MPPTKLTHHYLPVAHFQERHQRLIAAPMARTIAAAAAYTPADDRLFRWAISVREAPMRLLAALTGQKRDRKSAFGLQDFTLLERREDQLAYGLIGQFWRLNYGLRPFSDGSDFLAFNANDAAKLVLSYSAEPAPDGRTRLVTETRIYCPTAAMRLRFRPYWLAIRPVSGLIRRRALTLIQRQCEESGSGLARATPSS